MICSGIGGKGNAPKACDVGEVVGEEAADDDCESIVVVVFCLLWAEVADE